jgi:two-component system response regulator HupR/HoxA
VNVRIIAATNRDLEADVVSGRFRKDLFYRIAGITLTMPPLRERPQDVPLLVEALLQKSALAGRRFTASAIERMRGYAWPGNVRELQNEVLRALALADGTEIGADGLSPRLTRTTSSARPVADDDADGATLKAQLERVEATLVGDALRRHRGNKTRVAEELGLTRVGLRMKLERLGIADA